MKNIQYTLISFDPFLHRVEMQITFSPISSHSIIGLPNWIPGSYKIRDFAKNVISISEGVMIDKHRWQIQSNDKKITVKYFIYAKDISVRTAYLDDQLFFFNPSSLCMFVEGQEHLPCTFTINSPKQTICKSWKLDTALSCKKKDTKGFGTYTALNYDDLIDHPFLMGQLETIKFKAHNIDHRMSIVGGEKIDKKRLTHDLKKLCETQIHFFKNSPVKKTYVFLTWALLQGYGGLEHRSSSALMCGKDNLPFEGMPDGYSPYIDFLSLCSHEYFHTWHVKCIKPEVFMPYDLSKENYTRQLWIFEGFTSYYEDILLCRAGLISESQYLTLFSQKITSVEKNPGHLIQSVSDSSFCAWTKFYDPNENSPNTTVSYYAKGALIAWGLDVMLRRLEKYTLDDLMHYLWEHYGQKQKGVPEGTIEKLILEWGGKKLSKALDVWVNGIEPLPLIAWAKASGWKLEYVSENDNTIDLGVRLSGHTILVCMDGGAAQLAGISAGDELVACAGISVRVQSLGDILRRYQAGDSVIMHVFRQGVLREYEVILQPIKKNKAILDLCPL